MRNIDMSGVVFGREVSQIAAYLRQGLSVHLVGPRRSGRSQVLTELADFLDDDGGSVLMMRGNPALLREPFAAFLHTNLGDELSRRSLPEVLAILNRFATRRAPVLICDDVDELDPSSIGAIITAHQDSHLVVVTSSRTPHPWLADSLTLNLAPAVRIRMTNLELSRLHDLVLTTLGGPMEPMALSRVAMRSGGLYGLARAILIVGRSTGRIVQDASGIWVIPGELWSDNLAAAVEPYLAGADEAAFEGATALAAAGPLPIQDAEELLGHEVLRHLFDIGLAHYVEYGTNAVAGIFPPLLSDYLGSEGSPLGRARGLEFKPQQPWPNARSGTSPDVSIISHQLEQASTNLTLQRKQSWIADPTPATAMALVSAMVNTCSPPGDIAKILKQTPITGESLSAALFAIWGSQWKTAQSGDVASALAELDGYRKQMPHFDALLRAGQAHIAFNNDRVPTAELLAPAGPDEDSNGNDFLTGVHIECLISEGKTKSARKLLDDYSPMHMMFQSYAKIWDGLTTVLSGDLDAGIQKAMGNLTMARQQMRVDEIQTTGYVAAFALILAGRLQEAGDVIEGILATTPSAAFQDNSHSSILTLGALMALWQGRPAYARALASRTLPVAANPGPFPGMVPWAVDARMRWTSTSANPGPDLWKIAERRVRDGYVASALFISLEAIDYSQSTSTERWLKPLLDSLESPMLLSLTKYLLAGNRHDLDELAQLIEYFHKRGLLHFAIRAAVLRAQLLRAEGKYAESAAQASQAWTLSEVSGYERAGFFTLFVNDVGLSSREYEVMGLLATGMVNAEAATILDMSVRTVETHLHNVARKVGLAGKEALVQAINTWLRPPGS
jgi:DNA-binding CsgD family transcriptional regulator